jgi:Protein of unknown function (DUF3592)
MLNNLGNMLFGPFLIVCGIGLVAVGFSQASKARLLNNHGIVTMAMVTTVHWKKKGFSESDYTADLQFVTEDKQNISVGGLSIPTSVGKQFRDSKGGMLKLRYLPEDPQKVDLADYPDSPGETKIFGVVLALIGVGVMWWRRHKTAEAEA